MRHQRPWRPRRPSNRRTTSISSQRTQPQLGPRHGGRRSHQPIRTSTPRITSRSLSRRTKERSPAKVRPPTRRDPTPPRIQTKAENIPDRKSEERLLRDIPDRKSEEGHLREMVTIIETIQQLARRWHHHSKERKTEILYEELRVSWLLPAQEAKLLADLVRASGVHLELLLDLRMGIILKRLTNRLNQV